MNIITSKHSESNCAAVLGKKQCLQHDKCYINLKDGRKKGFACPSSDFPCNSCYGDFLEPQSLSQNGFDFFLF